MLSGEIISFSFDDFKLILEHVLSRDAEKHTDWLCSDYHKTQSPH
jgi:hypothetical protein